MQVKIKIVSIHHQPNQKLGWSFLETKTIKINSSKHYINLIFKDISLDNLIKLKTKFNIWIKAKNSKYFGDDLFETIKVIEIPKKRIELNNKLNII